MKEIMLELDRLSGKRPLEILKSKKQGKKVVEYFGDFIPEQWIVAAGMEPYLICKGGDPQPPEATLELMIRFMNPLAATMVGAYMLEMDAVMPIADCVAIQQHDCHYGRMTEVLEYKGLPVYKVGVSADYSVTASQNYYRNELKDFRAKLEEIAGKPIDDDAIRANYAKTNKINELLRKIDALRKGPTSPISFADFLRLNHYTFHVDYDTSIAALEKIYDYLKDAPAVVDEKAPRILVMGRAFAKGDYHVPNILEKAGANVVTEFMDEAIRPFHNDISLEGDVIDAYVDAMYVKKVPVSIFQPSWDVRMEHLLKLIEENKIDAVLFYQLAFDEIYDMEYVGIARDLNKLNIPVMMLESSYEYSREAMAPLVTRLESFVESLKEA